MKREWRRVWHRVGLAQLVPIGLGLLLIAAAMSKAVYLRTEASVGADSLFRSSFILASVVFVELVIGIWLLILPGLFPRLTRAVGANFFGLLACFSGYAALMGQECHCFGTWQIPAAAVFAIDLVAVALLVSLPLGRLQQDVSPYLGARERLSVFSAAVLFCALPVSIWAGSYVPSRLSDLGIISGNPRLLVLQPAEWKGKRFPLAPYTNLPSYVMVGKWLMVLHSHECPRCQELVPQIVELANGDRNSLCTRLALADLLPGGATGSQTQGRGVIVYASLTPDRDWFASVPVVLRLENGLVVDVCEHKLHDFPSPLRSTHRSPGVLLDRNKASFVPIKLQISPTITPSFEISPKSTHWETRSVSPDPVIRYRRDA